MAGITVARRGVTTGHGSGDLPHSVVTGSLPAANGVDDTAAIQAVLNGGGWVKGRAGASYQISSALTGVAGLTLDMRGCTITHIGGSANMFSATSINDCVVFGGSWVASSPTNTLDFSGCTRCAVREARVQCTGGQASVHMVNCSDCDIAANSLENGQYGVWVESSSGSARVRVRGNRVFNQSINGIFLGNNTGASSNHVVEGNTVQTIGGIGIAAGAATTEPVIVANTIISTTDNAIDFGDAQGATIVGNTIDTCKGGIVADWSSHSASNFIAAATVQGNTINNANVSTGNAAIYLTGNAANVTYDVVVSGNTIRGSAKDSIQLLNVGRGVVLGNACFDVPNTFAGVRLNGGANRLTVAHNVIQGAAGANGILFDAGYTGFANQVESNQLQGVTTKVGGSPDNQTIFRSNIGYNPRGSVTAPAFPATTVAATNTSGSDITAFIANGTSAITQIAIGGTSTNMQIAASGWAAIRVPAGQTITFTYAAGAPAWTWMAD